MGGRLPGHAAVPGRLRVFETGRRGPSRRVPAASPHPHPLPAQRGARANVRQGVDLPLPRDRHAATSSPQAAILRPPFAGPPSRHLQAGICRATSAGPICGPPSAGRPLQVASRSPLQVATRRSPLAGRHSQVATRRSPLAGRRSQVATRRSPLAGRHSQVATRRSPLAGRHSQVATRRSPLAGRHSQVATRRSPLAGRHLQGAHLAGCWPPADRSPSPVCGRGWGVRSARRRG